MYDIVTATHQPCLAPWGFLWNFLFSAFTDARYWRRKKNKALDSNKAEIRRSPGRACAHATRHVTAMRAHVNFFIFYVAQQLLRSNCVLSGCFACCLDDAPNGTNRSRYSGLRANTNAAVTYDDSRKDQGYSPDRSVLNEGASCSTSLTAAAICNPPIAVGPISVGARLM